MTPEAFRQHLSRLGYRPKTIQMLPKCVSDFLEFTSKPVHQITAEDIIGFRAYLNVRPNRRREGGLSESYIHHHMYAIKLFYKWLQESGSVKENPASVIQMNSPRQKQRKLLSQNQIAQLYSCLLYTSDAADD